MKKFGTLAAGTIVAAAGLMMTPTAAYADSSCSSGLFCVWKDINYKGSEARSDIACAAWGSLTYDYSGASHRGRDQSQSC